MSKKLVDVKRLIREKLIHSICIEEEEGIKKYLQKLEEIWDMNSNFDDFLLKYYFISYLNYVLLKDIGNFTDNEVIASWFDDFENAYVKLISKAILKNLCLFFIDVLISSQQLPLGYQKFCFILMIFGKIELSWTGSQFSRNIPGSNGAYRNILWLLMPYFHQFYVVF